MGFLQRWRKKKEDVLLTEPEVTEPSASTHVASVVYLIDAKGDITLDVHIEEEEAEEAVEMLGKLLVTVSDGPILQQAVAVVQGNLKASGLTEMFDRFTRSILTHGANQARLQDQAADRPCAVPSETAP